MPRTAIGSRLPRKYENWLPFKSMAQLLLRYVPRASLMHHPVYAENYSLCSIAPITYQCAVN